MPFLVAFLPDSTGCFSNGEQVEACVDGEQCHVHQTLCLHGTHDRLRILESSLQSKKSLHRVCTDLFLETLILASLAKGELYLGEPKNHQGHQGAP